MSDEYIDSHFEEIKSHASDIETRLDDSYCTAEQMKQDNHQVIDGYRSNGEQITLITEEQTIAKKSIPTLSIKTIITGAQIR